jgi:hypothetical protein
MDVADVAVPELSAMALREWGQHAESITRGLAHALNNRAAALSAIIELSREPDEDPAFLRSLLSTEFQRQRELAELVTLLGPPKGELEALSPRDVVADVVAALGLHAEQRERTIAIDAEGAPPVRAAPWMLRRALIVLCAASPTSDPGQRTLRVTMREEGDWMTVRAVAPTGGAGRESSYVAEMARAMGGEPLEAGFRLPTLAAIRRREGR